MVDSGIVAVDGTKLTANASSDSNIDYDRIAREIIEQGGGEEDIQRLGRHLQPRMVPGPQYSAHNVHLPHL